MAKYFFTIHDEGVNWAITGTRIELDDSIVADPTMYYTVPSEDLFYTIRDLLIANNKITYPKSVIVLSMDDITVEALDQLTVYKSTVKTQGKHILKQRCDFVIQFDFFQFSVLNNRMLSNGYYIYDGNREEKYLEIINTGSEPLIELLDEFLEVLDRISVFNNTYKSYLNFSKEVDDSSTKEEIDTAFQSFIVLFN